MYIHIYIYFTGLNLGGVLTLLRNEGQSEMKLFCRRGDDLTYTDLKNSMEIVVEGDPGSNKRREQEKAAHALLTIVCTDDYLDCENMITPVLCMLLIMLIIWIL